MLPGDLSEHIVKSIINDASYIIRKIATEINMQGPFKNLEEKS